jgi:hypothetical protein
MHSGSSLRQLPYTIGQLTALSSLDLRGCSCLRQLPDTISQLTTLTDSTMPLTIGLMH